MGIGGEESSQALNPREGIHPFYLLSKFLRCRAGLFKRGGILPWGLQCTLSPTGLIYGISKKALKSFPWETGPS